MTFQGANGKPAARLLCASKPTTGGQVGAVMRVKGTVWGTRVLFIVPCIEKAGTPKKKKAKPKLSDKEQSERFKETARMLGADESGKSFAQNDR
jgi:hypothetical protein